MNAPVIAPTSAAVIEAMDVRRAYRGKAAVDGAGVALKPGRITCLLGPSGCGKSTLLRLIAGLEPVDGGEVRAGSQLLSGSGRHVAPEDRGIGLVFQDYALFPHLTAAQNVEFGLQRLAKVERRKRALAELERVDMADRADAYPQALSGGQQQRVALARALARDPCAMLLDEPFSGLDGRLKAKVRDATLKALREAGVAALIVTHDAEEAMMMGDELALMKAGRILQTGSPRDCYLRPASIAAARLLGETNIFDGELRNARFRTGFGEVMAAGRNGPARLMARPEGLLIGAAGVPAEVVGQAFMGASTLVALKAPDGSIAMARVGSAIAPAVGMTVGVTLDPNFCAVFPAT
jgi:iron(III) transport system ATP-binding protein